MPLSVLQPKKSLTHQMLIKMGIRIAIVIILTTFISYWHVVSVLKSQSLGQLEKYIVERGQRESSIFTLAQDNHVVLKKAFYREREELGEHDPQAQFEQLFVKWADGTTRNRVKNQSPTNLDTTRYPSVFIGKQVTINAEIQRRVLAFYNLLKSYGPAWRSRFVDSYFLAPENIVANYWPGEPWALNATAALNIQNEEYFYVSDHKHNPARKTAWTGLYFDHVVKMWMVSVGTPVDDAQGRHIATIGNDIILNELMERTIHDTLEGAYNLILRADGRLIAHPDKITEIQERDGKFDILESGDQHLMRIFELIKNIQSGQVVIENPVEDEYLAVTKLDGPEWYFVTAYPKSLLSVPAFKTAGFILILGLISLLIEVLVLFLILRTQVAKPLHDFIFATQQIAAGNFSIKSQQPDEQGPVTQYPLPVERSDELGQLANSFHSMAAQLKTSFDTLATKNTEFQEIIADIVQVSQGLAAGNLCVTLQAEYQGDLAQIKTALERALCDLRMVTEDIIQVSQGLAVGNLQVMPIAEYRGDFVPIKEALATALINMRQVVEDIVLISKGLLLGDLSMGAQTKYQGDFVTIQDALVTALVNLSQVIEDIVQAAQGLAEGNPNFTHKAEYLGDFARIKTALEMAASKLAEATSKNAIQDWLKTGQALLNDQVSGEQELTTLAKNIIACLTTRLEAQVGMFYLVEELNRHNHTYRLKMLADYTRTQHKNVAMAFQFSEGMVGQAALDKQSILFTIDTGLAETIPRHLLAIPFSYEDIVKGVIELGFLETVTETQQEFLNQLMPNIGIAVNTAESRTQMQELLQQTQAQSGKLQYQQEELQHSNEELQSQSEQLQTQQEELRQSNEELEERSKELVRHTEEIQQKNLALEKTKAEMESAQVALETKAKELALASQYKSEFLANISHELRTPLNSMLILAQLLVENKNGNLTDKQVNSARTIYSAGSDLLTLINDILDLSKVEAGKMEVHIEQVSVVDLMEMIEQKFRPMADEKGLAFHTKVADDLPLVLHTDGQRLQQIINNLLSNAFKFTSQGEVKLDIQRSKDSPIWQGGVRGIAISVADTGIGIPEDKQKLIFEAFQQADGTTSRSYGGTGLGLSISRQLARLLGGELHLFSEEGQGSLFTLYLPEIQSVPAEMSSPPVSTGSESVGGKPTEVPTQASMQREPSGIKPLGSDPVSEDSMTDEQQPNGKSLLIIEDDRTCSNRLTALAKAKHFKCFIAEDSKTGLQLAQECQPNAIIINVGSPNIDACMTMDRLKKNPETRRIPVHFISATEQSLDAKSMGAIGYLHKPVSLEQIGDAFKKIEQVMTRQVEDLLVVVDNELHQQTILELVGGGEVQTTLAITMDIALQHLKQTPFDCLILDIDIEQGSGIKLLAQMQEGNGLCQTPVIIYAERELTPSEEASLQQCADNLMVNSVRSQEHLLEEATLFLHQLESHLPANKRKLLRMVHDKAAILRHKKVLIADDDMRNTYAVASVLEDREMEIVCAKNGNEALAKLEEHDDIAIVLMDIMMPEMDGYQTIQAIRKKNRFHKLPIVALTAKAMKSDKAKCIEAGANDYLSKPVDTDKLISLMRVWLYR